MSFRDILPASLQDILQNGLLDSVFEAPLVPATLYDELAEIRPWGAGLGAQGIYTRAGLLPVSATPITGHDASPHAYGFEQYSVRMDQWGNSIDTNMAVSAQALASKYLQDNKILAINAAQTLNQLARNKVYAAYGGGRTYLTTAAVSAATTIKVEAATGFTTAVVTTTTTGSTPTEGYTGVVVPTLQPVSATHGLVITVGGHTATVTGVAGDTLTLSAALGATVAAGAAVFVKTYAPVSYRPSARASANQLVAGDIAKLAIFQTAVTRLRAQNVPTVGGAYTAHVAPQTIAELFQTTAFQRVYTGRADSPAYQGLRVGDTSGDLQFMGRFAGIDWFMNTLTPTGTNIGGVPYYRDIVLGAGAFIKAPFERMGSLVEQLNAGSTVQIDMINGVARILRAPLDRLGQVLTSTWSWIGGYTVGTDMLTGDKAIFKRAVVVEHA